jgi:hypothetical protein
MSEDMNWAKAGLDYLFEARRTAHEDFNLTMNEIHDLGQSRDNWFLACKNIFPVLYHYSLEFTGDRKIPGTDFASPSQFAEKLASYRAFVEQAATDLEKAERLFQSKYDSHDRGELPDVRHHIRNRIVYLSHAVDHVIGLKLPAKTAPESGDGDIVLLLKLARRFHESVVALRKHPHGGEPFPIENEWDCQYLFRSILAAYIRDVRIEEWNPSHGGSSARCEFFIKSLALMVELKWVRSANDQRRIKGELLSDLGDYGGNPLVDRVLFLVYDPEHHLEAPAALQDDLSGPTKGLNDVWVIVSPPR